MGLDAPALHALEPGPGPACSSRPIDPDAIPFDDSKEACEEIVKNLKPSFTWRCGTHNPVFVVRGFISCHLCGRVRYDLDNETDRTLLVSNYREHLRNELAEWNHNNIPMYTAVKQFRVIESIRNYKEPDRFDVVIPDKENDKVIIKTVTREEFNKMQAEEKGLDLEHPAERHPGPAMLPDAPVLSGSGSGYLLQRTLLLPKSSVKQLANQDVAEYRAFDKAIKKEDFVNPYFKAAYESRFYDKPEISRYRWAMISMGSYKRSCGNYWFDQCSGSNAKIDDSNDLRTDAQKEQDHYHEEDGHDVVRKKPRRCYMYSCPKCFEYAVKRGALKASKHLIDYLLGMRSDVYRVKDKRIYNHFVVSPESDLYDKLADEKFRKKYEIKIRRELKTLGFTGGLEVFHPYRFTDKLENLYWSPHWHFVLTGYVENPKEKIKKASAKLGAVFRSIRTSKKHSDVYTLVHYLLSHAGLRVDVKNHHAIRYIGAASNRKFKSKTMLVKSSDHHDEVNHLSLDVFSGERFRTKPKKKYKILVHGVRAQFVHSSMSNVDDTSFSKVYEFKRGQSDEFKDTMLRYTDNVPSTKSTPGQNQDGFYDMAILEIQGEMAKQYSEKYSNFTEYLMIRLDGSEEDLCIICKKQYRSGAFTDRERKKPPDWFVKDGKDVKDGEPVLIPRGQVRPFVSLDAIDGMPYWTDKPSDPDEPYVIKLDDGVPVKNPNIVKQSGLVREVQLEKIKQSRMSNIERKIRDDPKNYSISDDIIEYYVEHELLKYTQEFTVGYYQKPMERWLENE